MSVKSTNVLSDFVLLLTNLHISKTLHKLENFLMVLIPCICYAEEISTNFFISLPVVSKDKSFLSSVLSDEPIICGELSILPSAK